MVSFLESRSSEPAEVLEKRLAREGYLFFPAALDPKKILRTRSTALSICRAARWLTPSKDALSATFDVERWLEAQRRSDAERPRFLQTWVRCVRDWTATPAYRAVYEDKGLLALLERCLGGSVVRHPLADARGARIGLPKVCRIGHAAHQDHNYLKDPVSAYTIWIPAGDCPRSLGGLAIWPRSHKRGFLAHDGPRGIPEAALRNVKWASTDYKAGDVLVFSMLTVHRALPNLTPDTLRFSMDFRYCRRDCVSEKLLQNPAYGKFSSAQITSKNGLVVAAKPHRVR